MSNRASKRDSLESQFVRATTDDESAHLNAIPDVIQSLLESSTGNVSEDDVVGALKDVSSLARGSAEVRSNLRDTSASKLISSIMHIFLSSHKVCDVALQSLCLLVKDAQGVAASINENIDSFTSPDGCIDIVTILSLHKDEEKIVAGVLIALDEICVNDSKRSLLANAGACGAVTEAMRVHSTNAEIQLLGLKAATALITDNTSNKISFLDAGLCEIFVSVAHSSIDDIEMIEQIMWVILHMSSAPENTARSRLGECGTCDILLRVMKSHIDERLLCDIGSQCIANLANANDSNKARFFDCGVCGLIATLLKKYFNISTIMFHVMAAITSLCTRSSHFKTKLGDIGTCERMIEALDRFAADGTVAAGCVRTIAALAGVENNKMKFAHIFPNIIDLLRNFPGEPVVAQSCCLALSFLHSLLGNSSDFYDIAVELNGTIMRHANNQWVMQQAYCALVNLSAFAPNAQVLADAGLCAQIAPVLTRFKSIEPLVCQALKALFNLCVASEDIAKTVSDAGVCEGLIGGIRAHIDKESIVELGSRLILLVLMNFDKLFLQQLASAGVCELVVECVSEHLSSSSIVSLLFQILALLSNQRSLAEKLILEDVMGYIVIATSEHSKDSTIVESACWAIGQLSFHSQADRANAGEAGVCELLIEMLELYASRPLVAEHCCCAIRNLSDVKDNIDRFSAIPNALELITGVLRTHRNRATVAIQCSSAIAALTFDNESTITLFGSLGACELLVDLLHIHPADTALIDAVLLTTVNMSAKLANSSRLVDVHACEELIEATRSRMDDPVVAERALKVILNLAIVAGGNVGALGTNGSCELVMTALAVHEGEETVAALALKAAIALAVSHSGNAARFVKANMCSRIVTCMKVYAERNRLSDLVCRVLVALTSNETRQSRFGEAGACEAIMDVIRIHVSHGKIVDECCKVVYCLARDHEENITRMDLAGVSQLLNRVLVKYSENALMSEQTLRAMEAVAANKKVCASFASAGVCELIQIILDRHSDDAGLTSQVFATIARLISNNSDCVHRFGSAGLEETVVELMGRHCSSNSLIATACNLTHVLCSKNVSSIVKFINAGMCEQVADSLNDFCDDAEVVQSILLVIPVIIVDEDMIQRVYSRGICDGITNCLVDNLVVRPLAELAVQVMTILCQESDACCERLVMMRMCEDLVNALHVHVTAVFIEEEGCTFLNSLCCLIELVCQTVPSSRGTFGAADIAGALLTLLKTISDNALAISLCFRIGAAVCVDSDANIVSFGSVGIDEILIEVINRHRDHLIVSEASCSLALQLVQNEANLDELVSLRLSELLVYLITAHPEHSSVAEKAFECIAFIPPLQDSYLSSNGAASLITAVVQVIDADVEVEEPTVQALRALRNCLSVDGNKFAVVSSVERGSLAICESILRRLVQFASSVSATHHALAVALQLSESAALKKKWTSLGICDNIFEALKVHTASADVCTTAFNLMQSLCADKLASAKLAVGVCDCFLTAFKGHIPSEDVVEAALQSQLALLQSNEASSFVAKFGASGSCDVVASVFKVHLKKDKIVILCNKVLYLLCASSDANRAKAGVTCEDVVLSMRKHANNVHVAESACRAVSVLAQNDANRVRLGAPACAQIVDAMKNHADNSVVAEYSCLAVSKLTYKNADNKATLHATGINQIILRIINKHKNDKNVKEKGTDALEIFIEG